MGSSILLVGFGVTKYVGDFDTATPWLTAAIPLVAVGAGLACALFAAFPFSTWLFRAAGFLGFLAWSSQTTEIVSMIITDGWERSDWRRLSMCFATAYLTLLFAITWIALIKPWHDVMWARRKVGRSGRDDPPGVLDD